ncbi:MFS transporter [Cellulomonas oligotrophica]|uniref:MFS transporter n=1 Tax=Cellulomonas oligotrophica TaxID=931536 RepID=UPI0031EF6A87
MSGRVVDAPVGRATASPGAWRLRALVLAAYCVNGFSLAAWTVRLPAIGVEAGLDAGGLGRLLMANALGTLVTIPLAGRWVQRAGAPRVYLAATVGFVLAYGGLAAALHAGTLPGLLGAAVLHGAAFALTNVPQAVLGTEAERRVGRTVLPQFHAAYSIAGAAGAAVGGAAAAPGVGPAAQAAALAAVAALGRGAVSLLLRGDHAHAPRAHLERSGEHPAPVAPRARRRTGVWLERPTVLLGVVVFGAALSEGAANSWMAPLVVEALAVDEGAAATFVSVFLVAQTAGRLLGGGLVDRAGRGATLVTSALVSAVGVLVLVTAGSVPVAYAGAGVWGLGAALAVPVAVSLAAARGDAAARIAAVTSLASLANVAGPPAIGAVGDAVGLPWAVGGVAVVLLAGAVAGRAAARTPPRDDRA